MNVDGREKLRTGRSTCRDEFRRAGSGIQPAGAGGSQLNDSYRNTGVALRERILFGTAFCRKACWAIDLWHLWWYVGVGGLKNLRARSTII